MQIVIEEEKIIDLLETEWGYEGIREDISRVLRENGTPLPKGHGDLYDDKALEKAFEEDGNLDAYKYAVDRVSPIIEADKGDKE